MFYFLNIRIEHMHKTYACKNSIHDVTELRFHETEGSFFYSLLTGLKEMMFISENLGRTSMGQFSLN